MPRQLTDPGLGVPALKPVAAPVDSFVDPQTSSFTKLSRALGQISPEVNQFAGSLADKFDANATNEGQLAANKLREQGLTLADATRKGLIPASRNPFYMAGLREQIGRNMADKYHGDLRTAVALDPTLQSSTNIADFDAFAQKFRDQWTQQNIGDTDQDSHFKTGFSFRSDAAETQVRDSFANGIEAKAQQQGDDATFSEVSQHVQNAQLLTSFIMNGGGGPFMPGVVNATSVAEDINTLTNDLIQKQGRNPVRTLQAAARAVAAAAVNTRSLPLLDVLQGLRGKNGPSSAAQELYSPTRDKVTEDLWTQNEHDRQAIKDQHQKVLDDTMAQAVEMRLKDPNADLRPFLARLGFDPHAVEQMSALMSATTALNFRSDQNVKDNLFAGIWNGSTSRSDVVRQINARHLNYQDANELMGDIKQYEEVQRAGADNATKKLFEDFQFRNTLDNIKTRFADKTGVLSSEAADRVAHAQAELIDQWVQHGSEYLGKPEAKEKWLNTTTEQILSGQRQGTTFGSQGINPAPPAKFGKTVELPPIEKRLPTSLVISREDLKQIQTNGQLPQTVADLMTQYNIQPDEQNAFILDQLKYLKKKDNKPK